jgi:prostaglandin-E synthase 1
MMEMTLHPAFNVFAICAALLVAKMIVVGHITGFVRIKREAVLNPEDVKAFRSSKPESMQEDPVVARSLRAHRNDLESTLPFLAIGFPYLLTDPSASTATGLFVGFTLFRTLFSVFYFLGAQPWRSLSFVLGELCVLVMLGQMLLWGFGH